WNYFEGLDAEEAAAREAAERGEGSAYSSASHYAWGGPGDGTRSRDEMRALSVLELDSDADFDEVKAAWRRLAKANHPDTRPGDTEAAERFRAVQAAWDVLRQAEERRAA
ncbi:J domain-containing protein, partial [Sphingomonas sp.]|uniref:J domain-containing protein n=1 Tax=Sphingomonas sp. TaxID=28214 RepID=UPI003B3BB6CE